MAVKAYKPTSPGRRFQTVADFKEITKTRAEKSLLAALKKTGGRNNYGRVTARHIGGGHKRMYRIIDFKRDKHDVPATVAGIEYDPNRTARIALLHYRDGEKRYIVAPVDLRVGDQIVAGENAEIKSGNALPIRRIPVGSMIHNIELRRGKGGQLIRSAGSSGQLTSKEKNYAHIKMPSGELRLVHVDCYATIGQVGNIDHANISIGKAGRARWQGRRPHVRGVAMNPVDHPMGGGEGRSSGGRHPCTPWGKPTKGYRTRKNKRTSRFIVRRGTK